MATQSRKPDRARHPHPLAHCSGTPPPPHVRSSIKEQVLQAKAAVSPVAHVGKGGSAVCRLMAAVGWGGVENVSAYFLNFDKEAIEPACLHNFFKRELIFSLLSYKYSCEIIAHLLVLFKCNLFCLKWMQTVMIFMTFQLPEQQPQRAFKCHLRKVPQWGLVCLFFLCAQSESRGKKCEYHGPAQLCVFVCV